MNATWSNGSHMIRKLNFPKHYAWLNIHFMSIHDMSNIRNNIICWRYNFENPNRMWKSQFSLCDKRKKRAQIQTTPTRNSPAKHIASDCTSGAVSLHMHFCFDGLIQTYRMLLKIVHARTLEMESRFWCILEFLTPGTGSIYFDSFFFCRRCQPFMPLCDLRTASPPISR